MSICVSGAVVSARPACSLGETHPGALVESMRDLSALSVRDNGLRLQFTSPDVRGSDGALPSREVSTLTASAIDLRADLPLS